MKHLTKGLGGLVLLLAACAPAVAGGFEETMARCVSKFANPHDEALVMLECTAEGGKLIDCKVASNTKPDKGFDKAAICVADTLPMAARTGSVRVPIRFLGGE
jgi:hypothetical protein